MPGGWDFDEEQPIPVRVPERIVVENTVVPETESNRIISDVAKVIGGGLAGAALAILASNFLSSKSKEEEPTERRIKRQRTDGDVEIHRRADLAVPDPERRHTAPEPRVGDLRAIEISGGSVASLPESASLHLTRDNLSMTWNNWVFRYRKTGKRPEILVRRKGRQQRLNGKEPQHLPFHPELGLGLDWRPRPLLGPLQHLMTFVNHVRDWIEM